MRSEPDTEIGLIERPLSGRMRLRERVETSSSTCRPSGVVIGPFSATRLRRMDSSTCSGSGVPYSAMTFSPACWTSQSNSTPVASRALTVASLISGPTPSPGIRVTAWRAKAPLLPLEVVGVDLDERGPLGGNLVLRKDRVHGAGIHARAAVDALVGIDEVHLRRIVGVDTVDR